MSKFVRDESLLLHASAACLRQASFIRREVLAALASVSELDGHADAKQLEQLQNKLQKLASTSTNDEELHDTCAVKDELLRSALVSALAHGQIGMEIEELFKALSDREVDSNSAAILESMRDSSVFTMAVASQPGSSQTCHVTNIEEEIVKFSNVFFSNSSSGNGQLETSECNQRCLVVFFPVFEKPSAGLAEALLRACKSQSLPAPVDLVLEAMTGLSRHSADVPELMTALCTAASMPGLDMVLGASNCGRPAFAQACQINESSESLLSECDIYSQSRLAGNGEKHHMRQLALEAMKPGFARIQSALGCSEDSILAQDTARQPGPLLGLLCLLRIPAAVAQLGLPQVLLRRDSGSAASALLWACEQCIDESASASKLVGISRPKLKRDTGQPQAATLQDKSGKCTDPVPSGSAVNSATLGPAAPAGDADAEAPAALTSPPQKPSGSVTHLTKHAEGGASAVRESDSAFLSAGVPDEGQTSSAAIPSSVPPPTLVGATPSSAPSINPAGSSSASSGSAVAETAACKQPSEARAPLRTGPLVPGLLQAGPVTANSGPSASTESRTCAAEAPAGFPAEVESEDQEEKRINVKILFAECFKDDLLQDRPLLMSQINNLFKLRNNGSALNYKEAGYEKLHDFIMEMPGLHMVGTGNKMEVKAADLKVFGSFCEELLQGREDLPQFDKPKPVPESLQWKIIEVFRRVGSREIPARNFRDLWNCFFPLEKLQCKDYGYRDVKGLLANIPIVEKVGGKHSSRYVLKSDVNVDLSSSGEVNLPGVPSNTMSMNPDASSWEPHMKSNNLDKGTPWKGQDVDRACHPGEHRQQMMNAASGRWGNERDPSWPHRRQHAPQESFADAERAQADRDAMYMSSTSQGGARPEQQSAAHSMQGLMGSSVDLGGHDLQSRLISPQFQQQSEHLAHDPHLPSSANGQQLMQPLLPSRPGAPCHTHQEHREAMLSRSTPLPLQGHEQPGPPQVQETFLDSQRLQHAKQLLPPTGQQPGVETASQSYPHPSSCKAPPPRAAGLTMPMSLQDSLIQSQGIAARQELLSSDSEQQLLHQRIDALERLVRMQGQQQQGQQQHPQQQQRQYLPDVGTDGRSVASGQQGASICQIQRYEQQSRQQHDQAQQRQSQPLPCLQEQPLQQLLEQLSERQQSLQRPFEPSMPSRQSGQALQQQLDRLLQPPPEQPPQWQSGQVLLRQREQQLQLEQHQQQQQQQFLLQQQQQQQRPPRDHIQQQQQQLQQQHQQLLSHQQQQHLDQLQHIHPQKLQHDDLRQDLYRNLQEQNRWLQQMVTSLPQPPQPQCPELPYQQPGSHPCQAPDLPGVGPVGAEEQAQKEPAESTDPSRVSPSLRLRMQVPANPPPLNLATDMEKRIEQSTLGLQPFSDPKSQNIVLMDGDGDGEEPTDLDMEEYKLRRKRRLQEKGRISSNVFMSTPAAIGRPPGLPHSRFDMSALCQENLMTERSCMVVDFSSFAILFSNASCDRLFSTLVPLQSRELGELIDNSERLNLTARIMYLSIGDFSEMERQVVKIISGQGVKPALVGGKKVEEKGSLWWLYIDELDTHSGLEKEGDEDELQATTTSAASELGQAWTNL